MTYQSKLEFNEVIIIPLQVDQDISYIGLSSIDILCNLWFFMAHQSLENSFFEENVCCLIFSLSTQLKQVILRLTVVEYGSLKSLRMDCHTDGQTNRQPNLLKQMFNLGS